MKCSGCLDNNKPHIHCPTCDNYALAGRHDNACPLRARKGQS